MREVLVVLHFEWIKHYFSMLHLVFLYALLPKNILFWGWVGWVVSGEKDCCFVFNLKLELE